MGLLIADFSIIPCNLVLLNRKESMVQKISLIIINLIFGSMVLYSYYYGLNKEPELSLKLWGGVPLILQPIIVASMFISAIGYFIFTYNFLINVNVDFFFLNKFNYWNLHIIYLFVLIPSMFWMNFTFKYMKSGNIFDWYVVVTILFCVGIASIILFLFTIDTLMENNTSVYLLSVIGASLFVFHTLFLDGFIWTIFFNKQP